MGDRVAIPKSVRFEVFKRDSFACQYCGRKAPEVILECDHIHPVAEGGTNAILNLVTACEDCNRGKGARTLDEQHILNKQRSQVEAINERRVQLEMLADWHRQMSEQGEYEVDVLVLHWARVRGSDQGLTEHGRDVLKKLMRRFSADEIMTAMSESWVSYARRDESGEVDQDSAEKAFEFVGRVAAVRRSEADNPHIRRLFYIRGILRNRLTYLRDRDALELMKEAVAYDIDIDWLESFAKRVSSWSAFRGSLEDFIEEQRNA